MYAYIQMTEDVHGEMDDMALKDFEKDEDLLMNIAFWNLADKNNANSIAQMIKENEVDIALFAEHRNTDFAALCQQLEDYSQELGHGACDKVTLISKSGYKVTVRREQNRYCIYECTHGDATYLIVGLHLPANPSSNSEDRKCIIRDIVNDVESVEKETKTDKTVIIGDYNASPFDYELIQKDAFNAVLYKELIKKTEYIISNGKRYRRFYNPMIHYISEESQMYGSFYYSNGIQSLYWYCYDQIIVRKSLMDRIATVKYCKSIGKKSLLKKVAPNGDISDHLPLIVTLKGEKDYD